MRFIEIIVGLFSYTHVLITLKSLAIHITQSIKLRVNLQNITLHSVLITMCSLFANLCSTKFTVNGISDQSNSPARRHHITSSIASTFDADNRDLASVMVWPTEEKSRSDCAELVIQRRQRATCDGMGYSFNCSLQWTSTCSWNTQCLVSASQSSVTDRLD